ncbi:glycoside hydrolase, putative [Geotalea daltonii FRC-32]|uniref:Glycoside hydrolase, putative n=1 Tax=Geotalea daltonii (strain DSM 22248 / JCM 15807 / FRC-32) TaxID=316067 RepID=B9M9D4_GEODF|nr:beta-galactosidase [Geotalea daltonii]ACM18692.1 glycoside hydrolase, putative [Geotalea daltonii FRC-32]
MQKVTTVVVSLFLLFSSACCHHPMGAHGTAGGGSTTAAGAAQAFTKPVSFSILQDYVKGEDLEEVAKDFRLMKELGLTTWRGSLAWGDYEPAQGQYDFKWLRQFVELATQHGMSLRPYIGYTAPWAAGGGTDKEAWNDPPARLQDWSNFVSHLSGALASQKNILSYEIYNEENVRQWWDGTAEQYNQVLQKGAEAIRSSDRTKPVIFGGMVYPDADWVKAACDEYGSGDSFHILPFHAYPETWTEKNIVLENYLDQGYPNHFQGTFIPWADQYCGRKPIWINEAGFANTPGKSETDQANWWARAFATFLASPRVEHLGIYQIKERKQSETVIGGGENYYLGISRPDRTRKMAFFTIKRLIGLLDVGNLTIADRELKVEVTSGKKVELYSHLFVRPDGSQVLFVWDKKGEPTLRLHPRPGSAVVEYALDGSPLPFRSYNGKTLEKVKLTPGLVRIFEIKAAGKS